MPGVAKIISGSRQVFTITQVNRYVKQMLEADALLAGLFIEGEISNFHAHSSGHMYFTMKDSSAAIGSVMFASYADSLTFIPKNGQKVIAYGRLSIYEKSGQYQLYVEFMEPAGIGGLQLAFAQLVEKLQAEGLFEDARKRPIPEYPVCIAVITSPTGAAVQDIIRVVRERNPSVRLVISPAQVQGQGAGEDLARALREVNVWGEADVIIMGRGGGSIEDLWAFNEEVTAKAIAASNIPVISAVGHETDITISDLVADRRAPTPTAAAQMVAYDHAQAVAHLSSEYGALNTAVKGNIVNCYAQGRALLDRLTRQASYRISQERQSLAHSAALLEKVSPYAAFKRGFALVKDDAGQAVTSAKVKTGTRLALHFADGHVLAEVISPGDEGQ